MKSCLFILAVIFGVPLFSQGKDVIMDPEAKQLLDSANYYRLRNPRRAIELSRIILERFPEKGNVNLHAQALLHCANSAKMLQNKDLALDYCMKAIRLANANNNVEYLVKANFMSGSVHAAFEQFDSTRTKWDKLIRHPQIEYSLLDSDQRGVKTED